ncbi:MAG: TetR/AcrR family transcriptional regulator [Desulfobacterales bacterium]|nr:TetR/AcrR family transcriptional regulator [Desulfobacterales bacterium]
MGQRRSGDDGVISQVKNQELVRTRRRQLVDAAVRLFIEKGFHRTPTRQIAEAAGFSIGSLYEYVSSKDDVLFLVCDAIHDEIESGMQAAMAREKEGVSCLSSSIDAYIRVCDAMSDHLQLIYQETKSLPKKWRRHVLEKEVKITEIFVGLIKKEVAHSALLPMEEADVKLLAHTIMVAGHMWAFRRWFLKDHCSLDAYIRFQTRLLVTGFSIGTI